MRIAICDDEVIICEIIYKFCNSILRNEIKNYNLKIFNNGNALMNCNEIFDIVLLDVEMPDIDGFTVSKFISEINPDTLIIFITSHGEMMQKAFHVRAFRYIVKPIKKSELLEALLSAIKVVEQENKLIVDDYKGDYIIKISDIIMIESLRDGCSVHTPQKVYASIKPMKYYMNLLNSKQFYQVHKSYTISFNHVIRFDDKYVYIDNDRQIEMSRRLKKPCKEAFHQFVKVHSI